MDMHVQVFLLFWGARVALNFPFHPDTVTTPGEVFASHFSP